MGAAAGLQVDRRFADADAHQSQPLRAAQPLQRLRVTNARCEAIDRVSLFDLLPRDWRDEYDGRVPSDEVADVAFDEFAYAHGVGPR